MWTSLGLFGEFVFAFELLFLLNLFSCRRSYLSCFWDPKGPFTYVRPCAICLLYIFPDHHFLYFVLISCMGCIEHVELIVEVVSKLR